MNEWTVFGVIVAVIGLIVTVSKPMINLNTSIVTLTTKLEQMFQMFQETTERNSKEHDKMWTQINAHTKALSEHESHLSKLDRAMEAHDNQLKHQEHIIEEDYQRPDYQDRVHGCHNCRVSHPDDDEK